MRFVTSVNHSSSAIQLERLYSGSKTSHHSNAAKTTSFPYCSTIAASSTKLRANSIQSMTDFTLLNYPPILGGWGNDKKCPKFIYESREQIPSPGFCPFWGGYCTFCTFWGGYWHILLFRMCKNGGISHLYCLPESYFPIIAHYLAV